MGADYAPCFADQRTWRTESVRRKRTTDRQTNAVAVRENGAPRCANAPAVCRIFTRGGDHFGCFPGVHHAAWIIAFKFVGVSFFVCVVFEGFCSRASCFKPAPGPRAGLLCVERPGLYRINGVSWGPHEKMYPNTLFAFCLEGKCPRSNISRLMCTQVSLPPPHPHTQTLPTIVPVLGSAQNVLSNRSCLYLFFSVV